MIPATKNIANFAAISVGTISLMTVLAVWLSPAVFLHDFSEWLYQSKILSLKLISPGQVQDFMLFPYLVPNSLVLYMMALLHLIFSPFLVGKIFVSLYVGAWCLVTRSFVRRYVKEQTQRTLAWSFLVCIACFSSFFWYGFIAYQTGLLLLVWFLTIYRSDTSSYLIALFSVLIFLSHAAVFIQLVLLIGLSVLFNRNTFRHLIALIPSGLFSVIYIVNRFSADSASVASQSQWSNWLEATVYKAGMITMHGPFKNFVLPDGTTPLESLSWVYWLGVIANLAVIVVFGLIASLAISRLLISGIAVKKNEVTQRVLFYFVLCLILVYVVAPFNFFGLVHPGGRVILSAVFVLVALISMSGMKLPASLILITISVSLFTAGMYLATVANVKDVSEVAMTQTERPPPSTEKSVLAYNSWLYRNTRFKYYNYRVFAFSGRAVQLQNGSYTGVSFTTGPISGYMTKNKASSKP